MARAKKKETADEVVVDFEEVTLGELANGELDSEDELDSEESETEDDDEPTDEESTDEESTLSGYVEVTALVSKSVFSGGSMIHLVKGEKLLLSADVAKDWSYHKYVEYNK
jgi:hypothetical protein